VRGQILDGSLRPGDILRLGPIADTLGVSLTPVREALLLLAQDGWISHEPNRGFRVLPTRRSDVVDIYLMWSVAEGEQAARAAGAARAADVTRLRELDRALQRGITDPGSDPLGLNAKLHEAIHHLADAPKLAWFSLSASRVLPYELWGSIVDVPGWADFNATGHGVIIDAIERSDQNAARESMREHFVTTGDLLLSWLDSIAFWEAESGVLEDADSKRRDERSRSTAARSRA
jgi:DNA-binding GntR family transcriptional regulator